MILQRFLVILFLICFFPEDSFAAKPSFGKFNSLSGSSHKSLRKYQDASLQNIRRMHKKQALQMEIEEINSRRRARAAFASPAEEAGAPEQNEVLSASNAVTPIEQAALRVQAATSNAEADLIYSELIRNQQASPLGLVVSYTQQAGLENQGFTYDQALAGITMLKQGDTASAAKILDFFKARWDDTGLYTVYNTQVLNGRSIENEKILGPNAWVALLAIQYHAVTGDSAALDFAADIARWGISLPHTAGGVAMGEADTEWGDRYSVENDLSFYGAIQYLATHASNSLDFQLFSSERDQLKQWLKFPGFAPSEGLFRRGAYLDSLKALDVSSWGILALGVSGLQDIGVDVNALVASIENEFMVNNLEGFGSFGGDYTAAKGFDFSSSTNAFLTPRLAMKWVEGTNQMITVYRLLAAHYFSPGSENSNLAIHYTQRADYFSSLNANDRILTSGGVSYAYADWVDTQVFFDIPGWRTAAGPSVASAAWVYYSLYGFNPFEKIPS